MFRTFIRHISLNTLQLAINQVSSLVVFILLAKYLSKEEFGVLNLSLAILLTAFGILSFGIDQLLVKKIAANQIIDKWFSLNLFHNLITGGLFYLLLIIVFLFNPSSSPVILLLGFGKWAFSLSMPYKQAMTGLERFTKLLYMGIIANIGKVTGLLFLSFSSQLTLFNTCLVFLISDFAELIVCLLLFPKNMISHFRIKQLQLSYLRLLKEALPQLGTVVFAAAMARFDWIFIGFFLTSTKLAEYSFVYKVFELSLFPLLVIAPLLIPRFVRGLQNGSIESLVRLLKIEMLVASFVMVALNLTWATLSTMIGGAKYGLVNSTTLFILSLSMPILYFNNFLWSLHFAQERTRFIFKTFAITFLVNVVSNCLLVPYWGNEGAACAYGIAILFQTIFYFRKATPSKDLNWNSLIMCSASAIASIYIGRCFSSLPVMILTGLSSHVFLLFISGQLKPTKKIFMEVYPRLKATLTPVSRM